MDDGSCRDSASVMNVSISSPFLFNAILGAHLYSNFGQRRRLRYEKENFIRPTHCSIYTK